jgi:[protein-PII] uridylyltransferase
MNICKLSSEHKFFKLDFKERVEEDELAEVGRYIEDSFDGLKTTDIDPPSIKKDDIYIDCDHSRSYALLRLNTADQRGLISYIITLFDSLSIDIATAKIHTQKSLAKDIFLIEKDGNFCDNRDTIIKKLTQGR